MISYTDSAHHAAGTTADGRDAAVAALTPMFADPGFHADVKRVLAEAITASFSVVEHRDVIQPIPETAHNDHPLL